MHGSSTILTIDQRDIALLAVFAQYSRLHNEQQSQQIAQSISKLRLTNPILIAPDGTIINGHSRLAAAQLLKLVTVPTITLSYLAEVHRRALVVADNAIATRAGWNVEMLKLELDAIAADAIDLFVVGFSIGELGVSCSQLDREVRGTAIWRTWGKDSLDSLRTQ